MGKIDTTSRRAFLKSAALGVGALALGGLSFARAHGHTTPMGASEVIPPYPVPWSEGRCAFCNMTIATPEGDPRGVGFREQSYAQIALAESSAFHFESIACMVNYAFVHGLIDGNGTTFYVTDRASFRPEAPGELIMAQEATFYWAERLMVVMNSRLLAFASPEAAEAFGQAHPEHGRQRLLSLDWLIDFAPLPEMNLIALLARHAGLTG